MIADVDGKYGHWKTILPSAHIARHPSRRFSVCYYFPNDSALSRGVESALAIKRKTHILFNIISIPMEFSHRSGNGFVLVSLFES